ncbi:molecular chaperone [Pseudomonas sp. Q1-7]|uniref:molecular chaperone n=1 Tax=Pseudomonas sp. Q1-7 TaxID=3020843 RepID=UPI00230181E1|nr:molecular chaperone [Pseudomonas sp. Q1-7]
MDHQSPHLLLRVPAPSKQSLSFCDATPRDLKNWIAHLPKANLGETARQLYQALVELNQLDTPTANRLQLLELIRPEVHFVCQHLERHFLGQSIVLDERPRKVANLCQALQNHLAVGYKLIVVRVASRPSLDREREQILGMALQRAVHSLNGPLIRSNQLYCPVPEGLWLELHQLYQLAQSRRLHRLAVRDPLARRTQALSVEQTYLVALLLGCARCNQMRQHGIALLAEILEAWSALVLLQPAELPSSLFAVAPQLDGPPRYKSLFQGVEQRTLLGLDPLPLVDAIKDYLQLPAEQRKQASLPMPEGLTIDLLQHLSSAWGDISERTFQRNPGQGSLTLCIGMSALHFFLADEQPFSEVLKLPQDIGQAVFHSISKKPAKDVWANAFDAQPTQGWQQGIPLEEIEYTRPVSENSTPPAQASAAPESYPTFNVAVVNHSPGGYCLSWPKEVPSQLQAGELLGVQDAPGQDWSIAVVRWIRQVRGGGTQMGIELVAPQAQSCGVLLMRKGEQNSHYLRALLLPAIGAISRPATLITPRLPFQEGNKVQINLHGEEHRAVLTRRLTSTGSFNQFEYRAFEQPTPPQGKPLTGSGSQPQGGEEDFDSLWKSL